MWNKGCQRIFIIVVISLVILSMALTLVLKLG